MSNHSFKAGRYFILDLDPSRPLGPVYLGRDTDDNGVIAQQVDSVIKVYLLSETEITKQFPACVFPFQADRTNEFSYNDNAKNPMIEWVDPKKKVRYPVAWILSAATVTGNIPDKDFTGCCAVRGAKIEQEGSLIARQSIDRPGRNYPMCVYEFV